MPRYLLERRLGAGGMAEVFRARQVGAEGFARRVAVKRVLPSYSQDAVFAQMFISEARLVSHLSHPNVVSVLDFDRDAEGALYLAMEYVDGCDAARLLRRFQDAGQPLPPAAAVFICAEVLRGLDYAHRLVVDGQWQGIVHRDVSPHNVLLARTGSVKLADFGIAKATAASTLSGMVRGKLSYMAPEQANGQPVDGRTDVFAVGVMLYELLSGTRAFDSDVQSALLAQVLMCRHEPLATRAPWVPPDVAAIVSWLMAADPTARPATARDAAAALAGCSVYPADGAGLLSSLLSWALTDDEANVVASQPPAYLGEIAPSTGRVAETKRGRAGLWVGLAAAALASAGLAVWVAQRDGGVAATPSLPVAQVPDAPDAAVTTVDALPPLPDATPAATAAGVLPPSPDAGVPPPRPSRSRSRRGDDGPFITPTRRSADQIPVR
jgi:serine/threonine protein kinase